MELTCNPVRRSSLYRAAPRYAAAEEEQADGALNKDAAEPAIPRELRTAMQKARDAAEAYQRAIQARKAAFETLQQNAEAGKRQAETLAEQAKAMRKAMEIYRRIASGGRVPPQDEHFLMDYSPEMYMAAKMAALQAKEHEKYDSVLEDEDAGETAADSGGTVERAGDAPAEGAESGESVPAAD